MKLGYRILTICFLPSVVTAQISPTQMLAGHVPPSVAHLTAVGPLEKARQLKLAIGLPLRNTEALTNLLQKIYDPADPQYHHFLNPKQFADAFGPTVTDYQALTSFAKAHGLKVTATHSNRMLLDVSGSVSDIEKACHVTLQTYHHPRENRLFYAPNAEPSLALATPVLHVGGLDDYAPPRAMLARIKPLTALATVAPGAGSGPGGSYLGNDFRAAYVPDSSLTGAGQSIGLVEFDGYFAGDISSYANIAGVPLLPLVNVYLDGSDGTAGYNDTEVALDIEMASSMAPGLSSIVVYEGSAPDDILNQMALDDSASQLSCSWSYQIDAVTEQIFLQFAAQGQSFFNASGDGDAWVGDIATPCDDPNVTSVGGTTLTTSGPGEPWASETVWNWGLEFGSLYDGQGSGGGISHAYAIPSWQRGVDMSTNQGSPASRNIPDVAMTADNIFTVADNGQYELLGGTSSATALFAAFIALANEQAQAYGRSPVGFINPAIYQIGQGADYTNCFHDIVTGNNTWSQSPAQFSAVPGYDLCTGWGTPNGGNLINRLAPDSLQVSGPDVLAMSGGLGGPFYPPSQTYLLTNAGILPLNWTAGCDVPWLSLSLTNGSLAPGDPAAMVALSLTDAATNLPFGTYEGSLWVTNQTDGVAQNHFVTLSVIQPPVISIPPSSLTTLEGTAVTFTATVTGGTPLTFQWQHNGTNLSDNGRVFGSQSLVANVLVDSNGVESDLTISNLTDADAGSYDLVATNAAGVGMSDMATLSFTSSGAVIIQQPVSLTALFGATAQLTVVAGGDQPITYQWAQNGINLMDGGSLSGSATATLTINNASATNIGVYTVAVSNDLGGAISAEADLAVDVFSGGGLVSADGAPIIVSQPLSQTALQGTTVALAVLSAGEPPLFYQWELNGSTVAGATNATLTLTNLSDTASGVYSVLVTNSLGSAISSDAQLTVFSGTPELITFDDLPSATTHIPNGYAGLSWSNFYYINAATTPLSGYNAGMVSVPNVAFNNNATAAAINSVAPFTLFSAYLTSAWNDGLRVEARGYNASGLVYDNTYVLSATIPTLIDFNYIGVTSVQFIPSGGSFHLGYEGIGGDYFVLDDVEASIATNAPPPLQPAVLYSFSGFDGGGPPSALTQGVDGNFYGVTEYGGSNGFGSVFKMTLNGLLTTMASFDSSNAYPFGGLMQGSDGKLYGTTQFGGTNDDGTVFCCTTNGVLTRLASFNLLENGGDPETTLAQAPNGSLYGTTFFGGATDQGCIFSVTTNGAMTGLVSFNFSDGAYPLAGLTLGTDGNFYGTTLYGGASGSGTVFQMTTGGVLSTLHSFNAAAAGDSPAGTLAQGADGNFYGVTFFGGTNGWGSVFNISTSGVFSSLASFDYFVTGGNPETGLIQGSDGNFYGVSCFGGAHNDGSVFAMTTNGVLTTLVSFAGTNGGTPQIGASLLQGSDGNFYGTAFYGGEAFNGDPSSGDGVVFRLGAVPLSAPTIIVQPSDQYVVTGGVATFKVKANGVGPLAYSWYRNGSPIVGASDSSYTLDSAAMDDSGSQFYCAVSNLDGVATSASVSLNVSDLSGPVFTFDGLNGGESYSPLVAGVDGKFYGVTFYGGADHNGTVFSLATNGVLTTLASFDYYVTGANPYSALVPGRDGSFYGTTADGGRDGYGTVFNITTNGVLTTLFSFNSFNGAHPYGGLALGADGFFYGTTYEGGTTDDGTVFRISTNGVLTTLVSFNYTAGALPLASLAQGSDGKFYGTTYYGGLFNLGSVFSITTNGVLTSLVSLTQANGANPDGPLIQGADGGYYGTASTGGTSGLGTLFRMNAAGSLTTLINFDNTNGANPRGPLVQDANGNLYGTAYAGGAHGNGLVFSTTTNGLLTDLFSFSGTNGSGPASLSPGPNGAFFGATVFGGQGYDGIFTSGNGSLFRIAPTAFTLDAGVSAIYGTNSVTLTGVVSAAGPVYPALEEPVIVTIDGISQTATINDSTGDFSINFDPHSIPVSQTAYAITYNYPGDSSLSPSINAATTLLITPLRVTLTGERAYDSTTNAAATILTVSNALAGDQVEVVAGSAGLSGGEVGTNAISSLGNLALGGPAAANYTLNGAFGAVIINPLPVTVIGSRPYDGTVSIDASLLSMAANYDGTNLMLNGNATLAASAAGPESIVNLSNLTLSGSAAANYTLNAASGTVTVTPLPLTITLSNASKTYGKALTLKPTAFVVTGTLLGSEKVTAVPVASLGTAVTAPISGSPYLITATEVSGTGGFLSGNYQITYNPGLLTIHRLTAVLTGARDYDATTNAAARFLVVSNAVPGDQVGLVSGSAGLAGAEVGTNLITRLGTLALGGADANNYSLIGANGAVIIDPLPVTLTGTRPFDETAEVDASLLTIETNYDGTNLILTGSAALASSGAGLESIVDFSGLTLSGAAATNYTLDGASGTIAVTSLALTITLNNAAKTYGQTLILDPTAFSVTGTLLGSESISSVSVSSAGTAATAPVSGSPYSITANGATGLGGFQDSNYQITYNSGLLSVSPLTALFSGTRDYDATTNATATILVVTNAVAGDQVGVGSGSAGLAGADIGTNAITSLATLVLDGFSAGNYTLNGANGAVIIDPLPVTLSGTLPYDGATAVDASLLSLETNYDGTNLTLSGNALLASPNAGSENIIDFSGLTLNGSAATNYTLDGASGMVTVTPLAVSMIGTRAYDSTTNADATILLVDNALAGDQVDVMSGSAGLAASEVGTNAITSMGTLVLGGDASTNYTLIGAVGEVIIDPLPVALNGTRPYDGAAVVDAAVLNIETNYDGANLSLVGNVTLSSAGAGLETISDFSGLSLSGSAATNYTLDGASGTVTVTSLALTITLNNAAKSYGQALILDPTAFAVTGTLLGSESISSVSVSSAGTAATAPVSGSPYPITASGAIGLGGFQAANYQITYNGASLIVSPLTVELAGARLYDATTNATATILLVTNAVAGDQVGVGSGNAGLVSADIGTNTITSLGTLALDGSAAGNYTLNGSVGSVIINPLPVTLSGTRPYDGTAAVNASLLSMETNYDGTNLTLSGSATLASPGAGSESIIDFSGLTLNGSAATNYTLDEASGMVTVTPLAVNLIGTRAYDSTTNAAAAILVVDNAITGDQVDVMSGSAALAGAEVGTNAITSMGTLVLGGDASTNYTLSGAVGTVIIDPLPVTLGGTRPYDGTAVANAALLNIETNYDGTNLGLSGSGTLEAIGAGLENISDFSGLTLSGSAAVNYTLNGATGSVTVTALPLTITLSNVSKTYGHVLKLNPKAFSIAGTLLGSETIASVAVSSDGTAAAAPVAGSPFPITASGAIGLGGFQAANYQITYNSGALTVHPLTAILRGTRSYDATTNAAARILVVSNAVAGDEVEIISGSAGLAGADVGTNAITRRGTLALGGAAAGNYTLGGVTGAVIIDPLPVTLSGTRPYDGTATIDASLLTMETNYDGTNLTLSGSATLASSGAGLESIADFSGLTLSGPAVTNYTLNGANGIVAVIPLDLTITLGNAAKTFGQTLALDPTSFTVVGAPLGSETVTAVSPVSAGTQAAAPVSGSPYSITANGATGSGGFLDSNYQITYDNGLLSISPVTAIFSGTRYYDATTNVAGAALVVSNAVGEQVEVLGSAGLAGSDIGTNAITWLGTLALGGPGAGNYTLNGANGAVIIDPLPVTLTGTRPYDGTATVDASLLSIETNYDGTNLTLSGSAILAATAVGTEDIADFTGLTLSGLAATNYTLDGASGTVTVSNPNEPFAASSFDITGTNFVVCWQSVPGVLYDVLTTTNLVSPQSWEVSGDPIMATDTSACATLPLTMNNNTVTLVLIRVSGSSTNVDNGPNPDKARRATVRLQHNLGN